MGGRASGGGGTGRVHAWYVVVALLGTGEGGGVVDTHTYTIVAPHTRTRMSYTHSYTRRHGRTSLQMGGSENTPLA